MRHYCVDIFVIVQLDPLEVHRWMRQDDRLRLSIVDRIERTRHSRAVHNWIVIAPSGLLLEEGHLAPATGPSA